MNLPAGFQRMDPDGTDATRRRLEQSGFLTFVLPDIGIVDRGSFFDAVRRTLPLDPPLETSRSWDALSDSLWEGLFVPEARRLAILWPGSHHMESASSSDFQVALSVLAQVASILADPHATRSATKELVVFIG